MLLNYISTHFYKHIPTALPITRNDLQLGLDYEYRRESES